jgi:GNAT superfamily N-acetyltransferase
VRPARLRDVPRLVRFYNGLSVEARYRFHPFPFSPAYDFVLYTGLIVGRSLLRPFMRRFPRMILGVVLAELDGRENVAGYGTMRGVIEPGVEPSVRFGFVVGDGFRGYGVGPRLLRGLARQSLSLGIHRQIGNVFASDTVAIRALTNFGVTFIPTDWRDPRAPHERNLATVADLRILLQKIDPEGNVIRTPSPPPIVAPLPPERGAGSSVPRA